MQSSTKADLQSLAAAKLAQRNADHQRSLWRGGARRGAIVAAALVALLLGGLGGGVSEVRAQLASNFSTTTLVVPTGTLTLAVLTANVKIQTTSLGCPSTGLPSASVTFTCSGGLPIGTPIIQTFDVASGPISETVTYNANGPITGFPLVPSSFLEAPGTCFTATQFTCSGATTVTTVPGGWLEIKVTAPGIHVDQITSAPNPIGTCSTTSVLSAPSVPGGFVTLTYKCLAGQSVPLGTIISNIIVAQDSGAIQTPTLAITDNINAPIPATLAVPAPFTDPPLTIGAPAAPTLTAINPSSGPAGTSVTLTGTNLSGATAANFGTTAGTSLSCTSSTSCTVNAPTLAPNTAVLVTVVTPGGTSNGFTFTFTIGTGAAPTLASINPPNGPAGTSVTLTGTNLNGATAVNFGNTAGLNFNCPTAGTSCTVNAPTIAPNTAVQVTVVTPGGTSNGLTFTFGAAAASAITVSISGPGQVSTGQVATFSVSATGSVPTDVVFTVNFGDASATTTGSSVSHAFNSPGTYTVSATASSVSTPSINGSTGSTTIVVAATGPSVTFQAGWNIVSGPAGMTFTQCNGPLYTYQAGDTAYEVLQNSSGITSGRGYWCYFNAPTTVSLTGAGTTAASIPAPASQWVMVGNPSSTTNVTVHGADSVVQFDQASNSYVPVTVLTTGHGAWAIILNGGTVTVSP